MKSDFSVVGRIMVVTAVLLIPSLIVALIYREGWVGFIPSRNDGGNSVCRMGLRFAARKT